MELGQNLGGFSGSVKRNKKKCLAAISLGGFLLLQGIRYYQSGGANHPEAPKPVSFYITYEPSSYNPREVIIHKGNGVGLQDPRLLDAYGRIKAECGEGSIYFPNSGSQIVNTIVYEAREACFARGSV